MGQTLSEPVVEKISDSGQDERITYGVSAMQGWRISMEDAHCCVLDLQSKSADGKVAPAAADKRISFFGVYDGHGGEKVAQYAGENLHEIVAKQDAFKEGDYERALKDGFLATDRAILNDPRYEEEVSGCTASVGVITKDKIFVGNAGDSRTVLGVKGRAKPLSFDHKPQNEAEKARICSAGGFVDFGRVNGNLALSRAIGDFEFKKSADLPPEQQIVTAFPDVSMHEVSPDDEFIVVACDGIWDCQSSQAVVEFVRRGITAKQELSAICENMMDNCLASNSETGGVGCDNMTMAVIGLLGGKSKEEWYKMVADRVANGDGPCAPPEYGKSSKPAPSPAPAPPSILNLLIFSVILPAPFYPRQYTAPIPALCPTKRISPPFFHPRLYPYPISPPPRCRSKRAAKPIYKASNLTDIYEESAEFRGPGIHHYDDSPDDYEMDMDHRNRSLGGRQGRIIFLGDGTGVLTDSVDSDMFDHDDDEEKDLESQVSKGREDTPGPAETSNESTNPPETTHEPSDILMPSSTKTGTSDTPQELHIKPATDTPLPEPQK